MSTGIFQEITLVWAGREYRIPPDQVMPAIAIVEDHVLLGDVVQAARRGAVPLAKLSRAFGAVLRFAGARVSDDEVYAGMFKRGSQRDAAEAAVNTLLTMMIPPEQLLAAGAAEGGAAPGKGAADPDRSSRKRSKPQSAGG